MGEPERPRVKALFLFNHKFERNLAALDEIYGAQFSRRHTIMPFAGEARPGLSRVYEMGRNFSGHLAQAANGYIEPGITHYVVISDDLLLNPRLDEDNLLEALGLGPGEGYIKGLCPSDALRYRWPWSGEAAATLRKSGKLLDWRAELPAADEARAKFEGWGLRFAPPRLRGLRDLKFSVMDLPRESGWAFVMGAAMAGKAADYPLLSSYSDFVVIPAAAIGRFAHYCGVFAAANVFAEVAVPTALALACDTVRTELALGEHFMDRAAKRCPDAALRGVEYWTEPDKAAFFARFGSDRRRLLAEFPEDWLYVHPVKLSQFG